MFCSYENKGVTWLKSRDGFIPGLAPDEKPRVARVEYAPTITPAAVPLSKAAKKNAKRRGKKKQQAEAEPPVTQALNNLTITDQSQSSKPNDISKPSQSQPPAQPLGASGEKADLVKRIRNLKKKLKQVDDLKRRIDSGEIKTPEKEQLEKVAKRQTILDEIEDLELDLDDD